MLKFLKESENFQGLSFRGSFYIDIDVFDKIYNHYIKTGENLLDDYCDCVHVSWLDIDLDSTITHEEFNSYSFKLSKLKRIKVIDIDFYYDVLKIIESQIGNYIRINSSGETRRNACNYTSKKKVRQEVFKRHGKRCLCCHSNDNIELDHIIPVALNGKNEIDNLQPLCRSCNSSKGTKTIDYRIKK